MADGLRVHVIKVCVQRVGVLTGLKMGELVLVECPLT